MNLVLMVGHFLVNEYIYGLPQWLVAGSSKMHFGSTQLVVARMQIENFQTLTLFK
jgi:hypothetical protein